jgi:hypothetical protein
MKPKIIYKYRGPIERGPRYTWRDGYSADSELTGNVLYPWMTKRECQSEAKLMGKQAFFVREPK